MVILSKFDHNKNIYIVKYEIKLTFRALVEFFRIFQKLLIEFDFKSKLSFFYKSI